MTPAPQEAAPRSRRFAFARVLTVGALAAGVALVVVMLFGDGGGRQYKLLFETGGQLVTGNEVLLAGQAIGTVDSIDLTDDGQAEVAVTLDRPLTVGSEARIRATSLSGIANRYVAVHMGPDDAGELPDGASLTSDATTAPVDIDQLFATFDEPTRAALKDVIEGQATVYSGAEPEANRTYKFLAPGLNSARRLLAELNSDQQVFEEFLVSGSSVLGTIAERRDDLSELTSNANEALSAIAAENEALDRTLVAFPPAMRQANTTFVNLRAALDDIDPLVQTSGEIAPELTELLRDLRPVAERAVPVIGDLRSVVDRDGPDNDLADALSTLPTTEDRASQAVPLAIDALDQTEDEVADLRPYTPDLLALLTNLGQVTSYYDDNGHYARIQPAGINVFDFDAEDSDGDGQTNDLDPIPPAEQFDAYSAFGLGPFLRCPGAATQPIASSNPFVDPPIQGGTPSGECDDSDVPPGP